jgi:hypothetical protein
MTMPRKNRRKIVVNDTLYHYKISGFVNISIHNTVTKKFFKCWEDWKPKWKMFVSPRDIREIILKNKI